MSVINTRIQETPEIQQIINEFMPFYGQMKSILYSFDSSAKDKKFALWQIADAGINLIERISLYTPEIHVLRERYVDGLLDTNNFEILKFTDSHPDYHAMLVIAFCDTYREFMASILRVSSDEYFGFTNALSDLQEYVRGNINFKPLANSLESIRNYVIDNIVNHIELLDNVVNLVSILADTSTPRMIWKKYLKYNALGSRWTTVDNLVVGKLNVCKEFKSLQVDMEQVYEEVKDKVEVNESSLLYYKLRFINGKAYFVHRDGIYATKFYHKDTQDKINTLLVNGNLVLDDYNYTIRNVFTPLNMRDEQERTVLKCEGLLAQFAS